VTRDAVVYQPKDRPTRVFVWKSCQSCTNTVRAGLGLAIIARVEAYLAPFIDAELVDLEDGGQMAVWMDEAAS